MREAARDEEVLRTRISRLLFLGGDIVRLTGLGVVRLRQECGIVGSLP